MNFLQNDIEITKAEIARAQDEVDSIKEALKDMEKDSQHYLQLERYSVTRRLEIKELQNDLKNLQELLDEDEQ